MNWVRRGNLETIKRRMVQSSGKITDGVSPTMLTKRRYELDRFHASWQAIMVYRGA